MQLFYVHLLTVMSNPSASKPSPFRAIPSVDQLLRTGAAEELKAEVGLQRLTDIAREIIEDMRRELRSVDSLTHTRDSLLTEATRRLEDSLQRDASARIRRVINATGVILHTNLGRAPLSAAARHAVALEAAGYCTLEYDSTTGSRGKRGGRVEDLLTQLTGAEAALVVNNCASAALLILAVLAGDGETIVSRGELVEIGGDFRVPDVMANSGTRMVEVGATNRTRLDDYHRALNESTRLIMRVHPSNYRIIGFTAAPELSELVAFAHEAGLFVYEDAGSGVVSDLREYGLQDEPLVSDSISAGVDVVSFSGDKLLGASQAGLIVGKREVIDRLRKHSLYRALRADKLCLAALEATLEAHRRGSIDEIPTLHMLAISKSTIENRAAQFVSRLSNNPDSVGITVTTIEGESAVGGGSGPNVHPPTALIAIKHQSLSADQIEERLRRFSPPVVARIAEGLVLLDLRTVDPTEEPDLLQALFSLAN
ncbi:MAG: L-seryl-tRNA(Sec) selenium transferase [Acidobacteriota bacterium]|nr:L-seryl-tRNA(Sec) selenium transferase [Acidobacteriota bacterium]